MNQSSQPPTAAKIIGALLDAANAAAELVARGKDAWDHDRLLRLAGEAVISRIGDAAAKLPDAHVYHRIDYEILWETLARDVPRVAAEVETWQSVQSARSAEPDSGQT